MPQVLKGERRGWWFGEKVEGESVTPRNHTGFAHSPADGATISDLMRVADERLAQNS